MRILLVDDDKDLCDLTKSILIKHGYAVNAFCEAQQGIKHARDNKPNLILMDIMLPGLKRPGDHQFSKSRPSFQEYPCYFFYSPCCG